MKSPIRASKASGSTKRRVEQIVRFGSYHHKRRRSGRRAG
jgi:hypothetical protein